MAAASQRRIRVVTLVDGSGAQGGGERLAREIATRLDPERFESIFCVSRALGPEELVAARQAIEPSGTGLVVLDRAGARDLRPWLAAASRFRSWGVDVLHTHKFGSNVWGALLKGRMGSPAFVAHEHTWAFDGNRKRVLLDRELIGRRADAFVAVSALDRERMVEAEGVPAAKVRMITNGIPDPPPPSGRDVRAELGIEPGAPLLGAVAALRPQKALDVAIRALAELAPEFPAARLAVAGGDGGFPAERGRLEAVAAELGVAERVMLLGERDDVPDLLEAFDLAVLSSDFEGSPLSVMEYMAAGLPVVATAVGGVPDVVEDGVTGVLVPPQDPAALAAAIAALLRDPERAAMGEAGAERRRRLFSVAATTREVESLYEKLIGCGG